MFNSLRSRLWLTNMIIIAVTVVLIILCINFFAIYEFNTYKVKDLEKTYNDIYEIVEDQYHQNTWDIWLLEEVGADILENRKILIALYDNTGKPLYDSAVTSSSIISGAQGNLGMHGHMNRHNRGTNPHNNADEITDAHKIIRYNEKQYKIMYAGNEVGMLILASTEQYNANELNYLNRITQVVITVGVIAMVFTIFASNLFSNKISKQISNITNTAGEISKGNYGKIADEKTKILELRNLILALNNLSGNLQHHEKLRKRLTQDIAHELRTPISTMQGNLEAVLDGVWDMDNEKVKILYDEVQRLSRLVSDLYNLSKYENTVLNKSRFDISELLQYVLNQFEAVLREKKIQVIINMKPVNLYADKDKLTQVFINLLSNAVKFTPENGNIKINGSLNDVGNEFRLSIQDTGIGISEDDIPFIFERFYRADKSRNRKNGGAGIGLSVVKAVVDAHGGTIRVNSELSTGTEFVIGLPLY